MATKINKLTLSKEIKYKVADSIAASIKNISAESVNSNYKMYFKDIISNIPISLDGKTGSLESLLVEDDARHITSLVIRRLQTPAVRVVGAISISTK